jgi:hypothetical protein
MPQRVIQVTATGDIVVEVACEAVAGDKDVRLAAETPAQRGMRGPIAGTCGGQ